MQKIVVKDFRQLKEAEIIMNDLVFLIGEQASGKSTLAKLIYFCRSLKQDFLDLVTHTDLNTVQSLKTHLIQTIQNKFAVYFGYTSNLSKDFDIKFYFSVEDDEYLWLHRSRSLQVQFSDKMWLKISNLSTDILKRGLKHKNENYGSFILQQKADKAFYQQVDELASRIFQERRNTMFFPAGRNITVSYPEQFQLLFFGSINNSLPVSNIETNTVDLVLMKEFFSYSKFLVDYFSDDRHNINPSDAFLKDVAANISDILHGRYKNDSGNERLFYGQDKYVPLKIASSGQQESIRIVQDLIYILNEKESTSRIIEEPETHLFPAAQAALVWLIAAVANATKSQFIITTHSPYLLSVLNNFLYAGSIKNNLTDERKDNLREIISDEVCLTSDHCGIYSLDHEKSGETICRSIISGDSGMIDYNKLDGVSILLGDEFAKMQKVYVSELRKDKK